MAKALRARKFWNRRFLRCELGDSAASADVARQARVECFSSEEASLADGKLYAVLQRFFSHRIQHEERRRKEVSFWTLVLRKRFFIASVTRAQLPGHPFASESKHKRATLEKGAPNTLREGCCFAFSDTLKGSGGKVVVSSSNTWREGGSRFVLASVDTSRESGGK